MSKFLAVGTNQMEINYDIDSASAFDGQWNAITDPDATARNWVMGATNGTFTIVVSNSTSAVYSTDFINWTAMTLPTSANQIYAISNYFVIGGTAGVVWYSTVPNPTSSADWAYNPTGQPANSNFLIGGGNGVVFTSANRYGNGINNWQTPTSGTVPTTKVIYTGTFGSTPYYVGQSTNQCYYSTTGGATWITAGTLPTALGTTRRLMMASRGQILAFTTGATNTTYAYSNDSGVTWFTRTYNASGNYQVTNGIWTGNPADQSSPPDKFRLATTTSFLNSADGITWTGQSQNYVGAYIVPGYGTDTKTKDLPLVTAQSTGIFGQVRNLPRTITSALSVSYSYITRQQNLTFANATVTSISSFIKNIRYNRSFMAVTAITAWRHRQFEITKSLDTNSTSNATTAVGFIQFVTGLAESISIAAAIVIKTFKILKSFPLIVKARSVAFVNLFLKDNVEQTKATSAATSSCVINKRYSITLNTTSTATASGNEFKFTPQTFKKLV